MGETTPLLERLRAVAEALKNDRQYAASVALEAADALEALTREREAADAATQNEVLRWAAGALSGVMIAKGIPAVVAEYDFDYAHECLRKLWAYLSDHDFGALQSALQAAEAKLLTMHGENASQAARIAELEEELGACDCPRPANDQPDGQSVAECVALGLCGCRHGARLSLPDVEGETK